MNTLLSNESSPYLRSHAYDAVQWRIWGKEAFSEAQCTGKPVFLSIGYLSGHLCNVMRKESFENTEVADILNESFIPILVDREERPDINAVYLRASIAMSGRAGWPMTLITDCAGRPICAGSYMSCGSMAEQNGLCGFLAAVREKWTADRHSLLRAAEDLTAYLTRSNRGSGAGNPDPNTLPEAAAVQLQASFDSEYGGFGTGSKYPSPQNLLFLMRYAKLSGEKKYRETVEKTLQQMYRGGIYDHIGGGFCVRSLDREWLVPQFEKTLAMNAALALTYTEAWQDGRYALYRTVAEACLDYCMRELLTPDGAYYNSQDSSSRGREGGYYLLKPEEVESVLGEDPGRHFCECYDITAEGNFRSRNIPNLLLNNRWSLLPEGYDDFREELRLYRDKRSPIRTEKAVYTAPNALMLAALSRAGRVFRDRRYAEAADALYSYLVKYVLQPDSVSHCCTDRQSSGSATLDDCTYLAAALAEYYALRFAPEALQQAKQIMLHVLPAYQCPDGGFFLTAKGSDDLIFRPREVTDAELPSGNGLAAAVFDRLYRMTGDPALQAALERLLPAVCAGIGQYPAGIVTALNAVFPSVWPATVLLCATSGSALPKQLEAVSSGYNPALTLLLKTPENADALAAAAPFTAEAAIDAVQDQFYLCRDGKCTGPIRY